MSEGLHGAGRPAGPPARAETAEPVLARALGRWDLTALGVNQIIGATIFLIGSTIYAAVGSLSLLVIAAGGLVTLLFAVCAARLSAQFNATGGPYVFVRAAFGRFAGFEIGGMVWIVRVTSFASIANGLVLALSYFLPGLAAEPHRSVFLVGTVVLLWALCVRGIRQTSAVINVLTFAKIAPLVGLVILAFAFGGAASMANPPAVAQPAITDLSAALLLVIFSLGGVEVTTVPAGESKHPRRDIAFAAVAAVITATLLLMLVQLAIQRTLPDPAASATPVADAAALLLGPAGGVAATLAAVVSILGGLIGGLLAASRILFALAREGDLPASIGAIHARWHTPFTAITLTALACLLLALTGSFAALAAASAVARLVMYAAVAAAAIRLAPVAANGRRTAVVLPALGLGIFILLLFLVTSQQLLAGAGVLVAVACIYGLMRLTEQNRPSP